MILIILILPLYFASILQMINKERINFNLPLVVYNYSFESELIKHRDKYGDSWFVENTTRSEYFPLVWRNQTIAIRNSYFNGRYIGEYINTSFSYLFHDTYKNSMEKIIKFRVNQLNCFNWDNCLKNQYTRYVSCLKDTPILYPPLDRCAWAWWYVPQMLTRSLSEIACVKLNVTSPDVPDPLRQIQKSTFICYSNSKIPKSDNPFTN